jgi:hypothetical protein
MRQVKAGTNRWTVHDPGDDFVGFAIILLRFLNDSLHLVQMTVLLVLQRVD